jgi:hypothetical protein
MRMCEKSHPLGPPSESPLGNFKSRRLLFEKGKRAPEHAFHRPGYFTPNWFDPDLRRTQPRSTGPFLPISIGSYRAALAAAIGSPCPYCGQTMQIPDRPPSRDHIKPRSNGHALACKLALVCCRCNTDKGSLSLGQWLTRLSRAGDPRAYHVAAFIERELAT